MPFSSDSYKLVQCRFSVVPEPGYIWSLLSNNSRLKEIDPFSFEGMIVEFVNEGDVTQFMLAEVCVNIDRTSFEWCLLAARTTLDIDLSEGSTACNVFISKSKPQLINNKKFPDPEYVTSNGRNIRGVGWLELVGA